ncbi:methionyl-tRNA formyltransferase [Patescibacteria group bacterium]|nr:methionyl-tRNA formyltransferase [Patescibacteria group bacterium]
MRFVFFGTPDLAVHALTRLEAHNLVPSLIVTTPDAPVGRKQVITPPPTKVWATERSISVIQPTTLKNKEDLTPLTSEQWDIFVVFAYGKIMPAWLLSLPTFGTINAHPSLLPKFRGASPIRSTLLLDLSAAGVTIIQMDAEMDHGPILHQVPVTLIEPVPGRELDHTMSVLCGDLLSHVIKELPKGTITPKDQDHDAATFCTKITKDMAELTLDPHNLPSGEQAQEYFRKVCAFDGWPETFFRHEHIRIKIKDAAVIDGVFTPTRVVPEGKAEMSFWNFVQLCTPGKKTLQ